MRKLICFISVFALCLCLAVTVFAQGNCGESITWKLEDGVLTLSGTGATNEFTRNSDADSVNTPWWDQRDSITSIVVEEGVRELDNYCFYKCSKVTSVTLPSTLERIETRVFGGCTSLTEITFPAKLAYLGYEACAGSGLTNITFQGGCPKVSTTPPFTGLVATVNYNGDAAFTLASFGGALTWNAQTPEAEPDNSPDPAEGIDMSNPQKEGTCGSSANWAFKDGLLLISGTGEMDKYVRNPDLDSVNTPWYDWRTEIKQVVIAKGIIRINNYAFFGCTNLESVQMPSTVLAINFGAFKNCTALKEITLSKNLIEIGSQAFAASGLTKIVFQGPIPSDIGDLMADGLTAELYYPCTEADASLTNIKVFGGDLTWKKGHAYEGGSCTICGSAEGADEGISLPEGGDQNSQTESAKQEKKEESNPVSALTIINICLTVVALAAIAMAFVLVLKLTKKES